MAQNRINKLKIIECLESGVISTSWKCQVFPNISFFITQNVVENWCCVLRKYFPVSHCILLIFLNYWIIIKKYKIFFWASKVATRIINWIPEIILNFEKLKNFSALKRDDIDMKKKAIVEKPIYSSLCSES